MPILISNRELTSRPNSIRKLLEPLAGQQIAAIRDNTDTRTVTYGVLNGSKTTSSIRDWRFKTTNNDLRGNYIEKWSIANENYSLVFAYLTIHQGVRENEKEIFSLHCDPIEPRSSKFFKYKSGPHIHIITDIQKISNAHIALNIPNHDKVIESFEHLNKALMDAIVMISNEMI